MWNEFRENPLRILKLASGWKGSRRSPHEARRVGGELGLLVAHQGGSFSADPEIAEAQKAWLLLQALELWGAAAGGLLGARGEGVGYHTKGALLG